MLIRLGLRADKLAFHASGRILLDISRAKDPWKLSLNSSRKNMGNYFSQAGANAVTPEGNAAGNGASSSPTPSEREEQLRYLRKVYVLPRVRRRRKASFNPQISGNGGEQSEDARIWVYWRPPVEEHRESTNTRGPGIPKLTD